MLIGNRRSLLGGRFIDDLYSKRIQEFSANLVAHWDLNDRSGSVALDKSGNGNDGVITGATLGQPGIGDGLTSMFFDGTNDFIDISAIASNMISNGGFETAGGGGLDIWADWDETVSDGALANEGTLFHTGADACKITTGAGKTTGIKQDITVIPGATYRWREWTRGDGTYDGRYAVYDLSNSAYIVNYAGTGVTGTSYAMVDVEFTAPAGCVLIRVLLRCGTTAGAVCYFDTTSLRRTENTPFDPHEVSLIVRAKATDWAS